MSRIKNKEELKERLHEIFSCDEKELKNYYENRYRSEYMIDLENHSLKSILEKINELEADKENMDFIVDRFGSYLNCIKPFEEVKDILISYKARHFILLKFFSDKTNDKIVRKLSKLYLDKKYDEVIDILDKNVEYYE